MEKKGLCDTCENEKSCIFQDKLPILQCEEFVASSCKLTTAKKLKQKKGKCLEEVTAEE